MKLIVGLGNPGEKYESTRHNIGFIILDNFAEQYKGKFNKGKGDWLECILRIDDEDVVLMKPMSYMNNSGEAIKEFTDTYYKNTTSETTVALRNILVVVDDFQIPIGTIRVRKKGSDGGHNGLSSITYHFNSDEFARMRVGIGNEDPPVKSEFIDFVLGKFNPGETEIIKTLLPKYNECILSFIRNGISSTMNSYNKSFLISNPQKENTINILKEKSDI